MNYDEYDMDDPIQAKLVEKLKKLDADIEAGKIPRRERSYWYTRYDNEALVERNSEEQRAAREAREGNGDKGSENSDDAKSAKQKNTEAEAAARDPDRQQRIEETIRQMQEEQSRENEQGRGRERQR
jgi:hypothetical protein